MAPMEVVNYSFPGIWRDFIVLFASATSAAWIIRPAAIPLLLHIIESQTYEASSHKELNMFCPPLASLLLELNPIPPALFNLLQSIIQVVETSYPQTHFAPHPAAWIAVLPSTTADEEIPQPGGVEQHWTSERLEHL